MCGQGYINHSQFCGPHIVTQVSFYRQHTCVLVGRSKYVHSTQASSLPQKPQETPSPPVVHVFPSPSLTCSLMTSRYFSHPPIFMCIPQHFLQCDFLIETNFCHLFLIHSAHITSSALQVQGFNCMLGTVVLDFGLCPPAWRGKAAIVRTAVCLFVNKLKVWPGIINPSAVGLHTLRHACPTNSLFLGLSLYDSYRVTLPLSPFWSLFHCVSGCLSTFLALDLPGESLSATPGSP